MISSKYMLSIAHGTTGAFLTSKLPPVLGIPLTIASHYLEDYVPHWDVGQGLTKGIKSRKSAFYQELFIDLPLSLLIVYFFFQFQKPFTILPWLGWFLGLLPDFLEAPRNFLKWEPPFLKAFNDFHHKFHRSIPNKLQGLLPQLLLILIIYLLK